LCRLLPGRRLVCGARGRRRPGLRQIIEQDSELGCRFGLERPGHPIVELRCVDPALRHMLLQKADRLITVGIADSRFHRPLVCRLLLRHLLGGIRLGCGRLSHNHQYPRARERRRSRPASAEATGEADPTVATGTALSFARYDERAGPQRTCANGLYDTGPLDKGGRRSRTTRLAGVGQEPRWAA
jgi:hypothetical protein